MAKFRAGIALENAVSAELLRRGLPNRLTRGEAEHLAEHIDLVVDPAPFTGDPTFEIQLTLRSGKSVHGKITRFVLAALLTEDRGIRVYIEICATRRQSIDYIATRVAGVICNIARNRRRFEEPQLLGVQMKVTGPRQSPFRFFSLLTRAGKGVLRKAATIYVERTRALREAEQASEILQKQLAREYFDRLIASRREKPLQHGRRTGRHHQALATSRAFRNSGRREVKNLSVYVPRRHA
ncbi:hypothetical protein HOI18_00180 [Candidatus Uhrbacteria bacterium]|nr:hypothetical protein [Candidatus Uhrbacteria bacterium]